MKTSLYTGDEAVEVVELSTEKLDFGGDLPAVDAYVEYSYLPFITRSNATCIGLAMPLSPQPASDRFTMPSTTSPGLLRKAPSASPRTSNNVNKDLLLPRSLGPYLTHLCPDINNADLQQFYAKHVPEAVGSNYTYISLDGGQNNQDPAEAGVEAALDAQYAYGLTYPIPETAWSTGGSPPWNPTPYTPTNTNEPYNTWLDAVLALKSEDIPKVISTSYGEEEISIPEAYGRRACNGFAQLGKSQKSS